MSIPPPVVASMQFSESQFKLAALVSKAKPLVLYADDEACDRVFASLAAFAEGIHRDSDRKKAMNVQGMELEDLLHLPTAGIFFSPSFLK